LNTMSAVKAEQQQEGAIPLGVPGLGERLRSARVARDLDLPKMAERIHLTVDMVDALEHDDYSEMPARVFVRGYIRNYARTVELPIDSVLAQFDAVWPDEDAPVTITPSPRLASDGQADKSWHRAMSWLLVLVMLVLFLIWWQGYLDRFIATWSDPAGQSEPATIPFEGLNLDRQPAEDGLLSLPAPLAGTGGARLSLASPQDLAPTVESGSEARSEDDAGSDRGAEPAVTVAQVVPADESTRPAELPTPSETVAQAEPESSPASPVAAQGSTLPLQSPVDGIVVRFNQDCWVDIRDSSRSFKLFGTMRAGSERQLQGTPPYKVVLGNASGVEISIDGEAFDLASRTINNVARFTLDP